MSIFDIPLDIFKEIFELCDFLTKIRFRQICKYSYENLHMIDLYNIEKKYLKRLSKNILKKHRFIKYLNVIYNLDIKHISWMKNLKELYASGNCGIDQKGIKGLNLIKLNVHDNSKIKKVSFMTSLKKLYASGNCGIERIGFNQIGCVE